MLVATRRLIVLVALVTGCGGDDDVDFAGGGGAGGSGATGGASGSSGTGGGGSGGVAGGGTGGVAATGGVAGAAATGGVAGAAAAGGVAGAAAAGGVAGAAAAGGVAGAAAAGGVAGAAASGGVAGAAASGGMGGAPATGCSDGSREAFMNTGFHQDIAGCSGAWTVAGVTTTASYTPSCNRQAGNNGSNASGQGCSVEDLCAEGWHVCASDFEVSQKSGSGSCSPDATNGIWITRQSMSDGGSCVSPPATNNLVGCGSSIGAGSPGSCSPLNRQLRYSDCLVSSVWSCGNATTYLEEANLVTKSGSSAGGVLCCKN